MVSRSQEVSTDSEQILHDTVNRRKPLELSGRLETPHLALTLSDRLMGDLRAVIRVLIGAVEHRWHHRATGGRVAAQLVGNQGRIWTPLSSVRTKPRFNPSYERRWFTFVASWLSAAGASTGQGSAQRSAGGGVALTRAERGGIRRLGFRSPSTLILRGGTASDCRRIFGPSREHARLRATMVNARGDANRWYGPVWPADASQTAR